MSGRNDISKLGLEMLEQCVAGRVRVINRVMAAHYDNLLREHGLTANQLTMLCLLAALGPSRPSALKDYLAMDQSTVSRNLDRMEANGWLKREPDKDGRAQLVALSAEGTRLLRRAEPQWRVAQEWALGLLDKGSETTIDRIAKKVNPLIP